MGKRTIITEGNIHAFVGMDASELEMHVYALLGDSYNFNGVMELRLDEAALRAPSKQLSFDDELCFHGPGWEAAAILREISARAPRAYEDIQDEMGALFPNIKRINTVLNEDALVELELEMQSGLKIVSSFISRGMLCCLGYSILPHCTPKPMVLVHKPERSMHPSMLSYVMRLLEEVSQKSKVWIITNNCLVLDRLRADQVSVLKQSKDDETELELLCDAPGFKEKGSIYSTGDYWVSFCTQYGYFR